MKALQKEMPKLSEYIKSKEAFKSKQFTPDDVVVALDLTVNVCIGTAGVVNLAQAMARMGQGESVKEILQTLEAEADKHSKLHGAIAACYIDKMHWTELQNIRDRIDQLAGGDEEKRQQIVDIFEKYIEDLDVDGILDEDDLNQFAEIMDKAETEIKNLNL